MNFAEIPVTDPQLPVAMVSVKEMEEARHWAAIHAQSFLQDNFVSHSLTTDPVLAAMTLKEIIDQQPGFAEPFIISLALEAQPLAGFYWCAGDVKGRRPDLSAGECREVLARCEAKHDASIGMNWDVLDAHADELYPAPEDIDELREAFEQNPEAFAASRYALKEV